MAWYNPHVSNTEWKEFEEESVEWYEYYEEQIHRCMHGWDPGEGKPFIVGRYYFVLNFCRANTDEGWTNPSFRDYQNDFLKFFEQNDSEGYNTGMTKARRKGFTLISMLAILLYDMIFYDGICDGLAVGDDETLTTMRTFLWEHMAKVDHFFQLNTTVWNKDMMQFGWNEKKKGSAKSIEKGTGNKIRMELMSKNTEIFKGTIMRHIVFEEIGKFEKLRQAYADSRDCFMKGSRQIGTALFGGTGGNVEKGSKDFMFMVNNPDVFRLRWQFVTSLKGLVPFIDKDGYSIIDKPSEEKAKELSSIWDIPIGECRKGARQWWLDEENKFKKSGDKTELYNFYQNNPISTDHIFLTKGSGLFDQVRIDEACKELDKKPLYEGGTVGNFKLVEGWREIYKANGFEWSPSCVEFVPNKMDGMGVVYAYPNGLESDIGGFDPYGQEDTVTSDSIGVFYIFRMKTALTPKDNRIIVKISGRPANIRVLFKQILYATIAYNLIIDDMGMLDAECNAAAEFFAFMEEMNAVKYLKAAPKEYNEFETKARNKFGRRMSDPVKRIMVSRTADYIDEEIEKVWDPELLSDWKFFGSRNTDHAFAFGMCIITAYEFYSFDGTLLRDLNEQEFEEKGSGLMKFKRINGQIVAVRN